MTSRQPTILLGRGREVIRYKHHSIRTERVYVDWIWRFVRFHGRLHPREMGAQKVRVFLEQLLGHVSVETTMIYTHVMNRGGRGVVSPADVLANAPRGAMLAA
jgi:integrase